MEKPCNTTEKPNFLFPRGVTLPKMFLRKANLLFLRFFTKHQGRRREKEYFSFPDPYLLPNAPQSFMLMSPEPCSITQDRNA